MIGVTMEESKKKTVEILGPGCSRCKETFRVVSQLVETERLPFEVVKNESMERMLELGLLSTPGVAIDGKVVIFGRIPKAEEIRVILASA
jgi:small redox-active disulfide protein 2